MPELRIIPKDPKAIQKMMDDIYFEGKADGLKDAAKAIGLSQPLDGGDLDALFKSMVRRLKAMAEELEKSSS